MHVTGFDAWAETHHIDTMEVALVDLTGALRGKRLPVRAFSEGGMAGEVGFCSVVFAWDYAADVLPDASLNWTGGYPDVFARPDLSALYPLSWRPGRGLVFCDVADEHGEPVEVSPRQILRRVVRELQRAGYQAKVGLETEFYLLDPQTGQPRGTRNPVYSLHDDSALEPVLADIRASLLAAGIEVEACGPEYAAGQVEITMRYDDPLRAADQLMLFRYVVKQIAAAHGLLATFMAKPFADRSGSGLHVHQSLWHSDGAGNAFWDNERAGLSRTAEHYLAGLLRFASETHAVAVPTPNGYRRMSPYSFAPVTLSWGTDNRCTAVRALPRGASGARLESRISAADANPYLLLATTLMAGLTGIREAMPLAPPVKKDAYRSADHEPLPSELSAAVTLLRTSAFARSVLGTQTCELIAEVGERETALYREQVSDWERVRYLDAV